MSLAKDPYGIFALVLTPTRELAIQIAEQFRALRYYFSVENAVLSLDLTPVHPSVFFL